MTAVNPISVNTISVRLMIKVGLVKLTITVSEGSPSALLRFAPQRLQYGSPIAYSVPQEGQNIVVNGKSLIVNSKSQIYDLLRGR